MKSTTFAAVLALATMVIAAPVAPAKRQCSAPVPVPSSTSTPDPVPTSTPETPSTSVPEPPSTDTPTSSDPPAPTETATPPPSGGGSASSGPWFSVYADTGVTADNFPTPDQLGDWNDLILAFWLSAGAWDSAFIWTSLDAGKRKEILDSYHAAGKKIRVAAFGATEFPLMSGGDPTTIGNNLAAFVKQYELDGVDIDYEDSASFESATGGGEEFLITLTKVLREQLPSPQYVISHAPQSPYFTTGDKYPNKAYLKVHQEVGDLIDMYEMQWYNQGSGAYESCDGLWNKSPDAWPGTTVSEIVASGIPGSKIVIGKPGQQGDANNGLMAPADIGACITSKNGAHEANGVMAWQWSHAGADWIAAAKGNL
ncbi:glycoside hydrolase [Auriculariales sp. MPI-PUGE-AT-0066]|nr:glycoside hydrolase [Auriculariales sp. MPI-PUGE-AT-0066]